MSHTTAMPSITPPQDIYARLLSCSRGYPLWTPEPSNELLMERRDGLRIGDVGVVLEDGGVDVLFNLCLPADHPFHLRHGVPQGFTCISPNLLDIRTIANAEPPSYVIPSSSLTRVKTSGSANDVLESHTSNALPYRFNLSSSEGAALVLPKGAERHDLLNKELFLEQASQHGTAWYHYAVNRRGRVISSDSLYLITGVHKTLSWSVAVFENASANGHHTTYFRQIERDNRPPTYSWEVTGNCALEWRVAPDAGPHIDYSIPNQAVFIRGLKVAIRIGLLGTRWVSVEADSPSTRSENIKLSSVVPGNSSILGRFAGFLPSSGSAYFPTATRSEGTINADEERPQSSTVNRGGYDGIQVKIQPVPDVLRPFHPSDVINRHLLEKDPSANIAITHDDHWISLLENMSFTHEELLDESSVEIVLSQNYRTVSRDGVIYLERKLEQPTGSLSASTSEQMPAPAISPRLSSSHPSLPDDVYKSIPISSRPTMIASNDYGDNHTFMDEDENLLATHLATPPPLPAVYNSIPISLGPTMVTNDYGYNRTFTHEDENLLTTFVTPPPPPAVYNSMPISSGPTMVMSSGYSYNHIFTRENENLLATHFAPLAIQPQHCYHQCFWVAGHATCNALVLGHEFSEHLRTRHVPAGTDNTPVRCCWAGCSSEMKKEQLMRHVQEKHLEWKYTCPNCFERFTRNYTRDQHVARKHST